MFKVHKFNKNNNKNQISFSQLTPKESRKIRTAKRVMNMEGSWRKIRMVMTVKMALTMLLRRKLKSTKT